MSDRILLTGMLAMTLGVLHGLPARAAAEDKPAEAPQADEQQKIRIVSIEVRGNKQVPKAEIVGALGIHEGQEIQLADLQAGLKRVAELGTFSAVVPTLVPAQLGGLVLTLQVTENPVLRLVRIDGAQHFKPDQLTRPFEPLRGKILSAQNVKKAIDEIEERYAKDGLILARI
ncbi:MAG TPA: POTRA domain-containing protein, partial [Stenomitos sp.]